MKRLGMEKSEMDENKKPVRSVHYVRAFANEWRITKEFMLMCRQNPEACRKAVEELRPQIPNWEKKVKSRLEKEEGWSFPEQ